MMPVIFLLIVQSISGQQSRRAKPGGCLLPGAEMVRGGGAAQRVGEHLDQL